FEPDVAAEAARVASGHAAGDAVVLHKLHKQYGREKVALHELSLGIAKGECFGYLGINGAGKSTTLQILHGALAPSSGAVAVNGHALPAGLRQARAATGYCPQFDALHDLLTVEEELELYARLKGVVNVAGAVEAKLAQFGLQPFRAKRTQGLSGGNKRKVSTAIALLGDPALLLLDEPSTGMDPAARRAMWDVIVGVLSEKRCAVVLTTHSMEECQALCTRIGILVSGQLKCLGSAQHLKH
ncbi:ATP-binding Cassette (ABC) Superfamily, partial [Achlya hypogyna]